MKDYYWYKARVDRIIDGDTLVLLIDLGLNIWKKETVRLHRVNAYELRGENKKDGEAAKAYVFKHATPGSMVDVRTHRDKEGKYGRLLVDLYLHDDPCLNDRLVSYGLAVYYP